MHRTHLLCNLRAPSMGRMCAVIPTAPLGRASVRLDRLPHIRPTVIIDDIRPFDSGGRAALPSQDAAPDPPDNLTEPTRRMRFRQNVGGVALASNPNNGNATLTNDLLNPEVLNVYMLRPADPVPRRDRLRRGRVNEQGNTKMHAKIMGNCLKT